MDRRRSHGDWDHVLRGQQRSRRTARFGALGALAATVALLVAIVLNTGAERAPAAGGSLQPQIEEMAIAFGKLGNRLTRLEKGSSPRRARKALHKAVKAREKLVADMKRMRASGQIGEDFRLDNALDAGWEYLDVVGSMLANPRTRLRPELATRAQRAAAAFDAMGDASGLTTVVRGWRQLADYTDRRARRAERRRRS